MSWNMGSASGRFPSDIGFGWRFNFGKHRNETLGDILEEDPSYLKWCVDEVEGFSEALHPDVAAAIEDAEISKDWPSDDDIW